MKDDALPTIDPAQLAAVSGGAAQDMSTQVQALVQSLQDDLQQLAQGQQNNPMSEMMQILPMMMMMRGHGHAAAPPPAAPPGPIQVTPDSGWTKVSG
jgi:hypothetical protein